MVNYKMFLKKAMLRFTGRYSHIRTTVNVKSKWFGNSYGGFYIIEDLLSADSIIYSFGIGRDVSFDLDLYNRYGCKIFGFDPTPKSIAWVKKQHLPEQFKFYEYGLATNSGKIKFNLPKNETHVSGSIIDQANVNSKNTIEVNMKTFEDITLALNHSTVDVLKLDIEGAEYDVLESILQSKVLVKQFLIEFHERFFENGRVKTEKALNSLAKNGFDLYAISDSFQELSFVKSSVL